MDSVRGGVNLVRGGPQGSPDKVLCRIYIRLGLIIMKGNSVLSRSGFSLHFPNHMTTNVYTRKLRSRGCPLPKSMVVYQEHMVAHVLCSLAAPLGCTKGAETHSSSPQGPGPPNPLRE